MNERTNTEPLRSQPKLDPTTITHKGNYEKFMDSMIQFLNSFSVPTEATEAQCGCWLST